ncbi:MAG TPA: DUF1622 domain-containing protein [Longimicrobiales bacterium]
MREFLATATDFAVPLIDTIALVVIAIGTAEALVRGIRAMLLSRSTRVEREVWLGYARWLVAGLTFQLAADIIETAVAPTWDDIGRVAAIALIRTFLDFTLEREVSAREHPE